jgi:hypothetical protein
MQPIIYLYFMCYFSSYTFRALTGPSSGVSWAACLCYHLVHAVLLSVLASVEVALSYIYFVNHFSYSLDLLNFSVLKLLRYSILYSQYMSRKNDKHCTNFVRFMTHKVTIK